MQSFTRVPALLGLFVVTSAVMDIRLLLADESRLTSVTSGNFIAHTYPGGPSAEKVAKICELLREQLVRAWCVSELSGWNPRCEVRVYASRNQYIQAVGPAGAQTLGSSLIQVNAVRTLSRRIDLLADSAGNLPALPHELTHVVMSDRFGGRQPPHWLDEGAAMLADSEQKKSLHERDCRKALHDGSALPLSVLLHLEQFTSADQMPAFYGQSASLMKFLCSKGDINKITRFGVDAASHGYDQALLKHFEIKNVLDLEKQWKHFVYNTDASQRLPAVLTVSFTP
ncbi:hypothetical protein [Novipirellula rosea]|uniref:Peptidase MA-like domain-containing protein n=1 Tax=Novipirellula rosea TaxID=1031540 RepID=A0ABP8NN25_9BACT